MLNSSTFKVSSHNNEHYISDIPDSTFEFIDASVFQKPSRFRLCCTRLLLKLYGVTFVGWLLIMFFVGLFFSVITQGTLYSGTGQLFIRSKAKNGRVFMVPPVHYDRSMITHNNREVAQHLFLTNVRNDLKKFGGEEDLFVHSEKHPVRIVAENELQTFTSEHFLKQFVAKSKPIVFKGFAKTFPAYQRWTTDDYFKSTIGNVRIRIEVSPLNQANNIPQYRRMAMSDFLQVYSKESRRSNYYLAETSMDNFKELKADYPQQTVLFPDHLFKNEATQLWISAGGTTTPMHNDEHENLICQIVGRRVVLMFDHFQNDLIYAHSHGGYTEVDPETPNLNKHPRFKYSKAIKVNLHEGDCLYIPAYHYHLMKASVGRNVAINYWYQPFSNLDDMIYLTLASREWRNPDDPEDGLIKNRKRGQVVHLDAEQLEEQEEIDDLNE